MSVEFYMAEVTTPDPPALIEWYVQAVGLTVTLTDPAGGFTLLGAPGGGRLAIKAGEAGRATLHFRVEDLTQAATRLRAAGMEPGEVKVSREGYARLAVSDPAGNQVVMFAWATAGVGQPESEPT